MNWLYCGTYFLFTFSQWCQYSFLMSFPIFLTDSTVRLCNPPVQLPLGRLFLYTRGALWASPPRWNPACHQTPCLMISHSALNTLFILWMIARLSPRNWLNHYFYLLVRVASLVDLHPSFYFQMTLFSFLEVAISMACRGTGRAPNSILRPPSPSM